MHQKRTCVLMYCESEGKCHGVVFVYFNDMQKSKILDNCDKLAKRHRVEPELTIRRLKDRGEIFIDFYDVYHHEDQAFFEDLVDVLGAKLCDCEDV